MHSDDRFAASVSHIDLAGMRAAEAAARHGAMLAWNPFDISTFFARAGGPPPGRRHPGRREWRSRELRRQAARLAMPIHPEPAHWPTAPAPSWHAVMADGTGDVAAPVAGLTRVCRDEERDVEGSDVVGDSLEAAGFDQSVADRGREARADTYALEPGEAVAGGAFGAPFHIADDGRFREQDRIGDPEAHLHALA